MTIHHVVAISDRAVRAYQRPFFVPSPGWAMRSFQDEVNRAAEDNMMYRHPEDFELHYLGTFDDAQGKFTLGEQPELLMRGKQAQQGETS